MGGITNLGLCPNKKICSPPSQYNDCVNCGHDTKRGFKGLRGIFDRVTINNHHSTKRDNCIRSEINLQEQNDTLANPLLQRGDPKSRPK